MTTLTRFTGTESRALKMNLGGGKTEQFLYSSLTNLVSLSKYGLANSSLRRSFQDFSRRTSIRYILVMWNKLANQERIDVVMAALGTNGVAAEVVENREPGKRESKESLRVRKWSQ